MLSINFKRSNYDCCLYYKGEVEKQIYIILYVDDLLICCSDLDEIENVKKVLTKRFQMKNLGEAKQYLGIEIDYNCREYTMKLSQSNYIESLAEKYDVVSSKPVDIPIESNLKLEPEEHPSLDIQYRNLIGALLYVAGGIRPDVSSPVNYLSRFQNSYCQTHYKYALRVLKYLYSTRDVKLCFSRNSSEVMDAYVDADWASDSTDRKSTTGILIRVYGNPILWKSKKQAIVSRASTHAEFYALAECVQEVLPVRGILNDFDIKLLQLKYLKTTQGNCVSKEW